MFSGSNHGMSTFDDSSSFNDVLHIIFPETETHNRELRQKSHSQAVKKCDQNNDQTLQIDDFVEFMWENAPEFVFEAKTVGDFKVNTLHWLLEDNHNRAESAGFRSASSNNDPNSSPTTRSATAEEKRPGDNNEVGVHGAEAGGVIFGQITQHNYYGNVNHGRGEDQKLSNKATGEGSH